MQSEIFETLYSPFQIASESSEVLLPHTIGSIFFLGMPAKKTALVIRHVIEPPFSSSSFVNMVLDLSFPGPKTPDLYRSRKGKPIGPQISTGTHMFVQREDLCQSRCTCEKTLVLCSMTHAFAENKRLGKSMSLNSTQGGTIRGASG